MFNRAISFLDSVVWGPPTLAVFLFTGLFLSIKTGFFQIFGVREWFGRTLGRAFRRKKIKKSSSDGSVSQFGALASSLAACLGVGNIVGTATAIRAGGPGAAFWICVSSVLGEATCCCENILGIKYRIRDSRGRWTGGPALYIERGLGKRRLAKLYSVFLIGASLGMGNMTQANSAASGLSAFGVPPLPSAILICSLVAFAVAGGLKRIAGASEKLIPALSVVFVSACFGVIIVNYKNIFPCLATMVKEAFTPRAAAGYGFAKAARYGISRGVFSNEAGLGGGAIIHSAADCDEPGEQGMWGVLEVFIDSAVMFFVAAAILVSGVWSPGSSLDGARLCSAAFESVFGEAGGYFLNACVCLFAFATLTAWSYYGASGAEYLFGEKSGAVYNAVYVCAAFVGSLTRLDFVWSVSDVMNGLMAAPNIFALLSLSNEAAELLAASRKNKGKPRRLKIAFSPDVF